MSQSTWMPLSFSALTVVTLVRWDLSGQVGETGIGNERLLDLRLVQRQEWSQGLGSLAGIRNLPGVTPDRSHSRHLRPVPEDSGPESRPLEPDVNMTLALGLRQLAVVVPFQDLQVHQPDHKTRDRGQDENVE